METNIETNNKRKIAMKQKVLFLALVLFCGMQAMATNLVVERYAGAEIPIAATKEIGHGTDSKAIIIGQKLILENKNFDI